MPNYDNQMRMGMSLNEYPSTPNDASGQNNSARMQDQGMQLPNYDMGPEGFAPQALPASIGPMQGYANNMDPEMLQQIIAMMMATQGSMGQSRPNNNMGPNNYMGSNNLGDSSGQNSTYDYYK